MKINSQYEQKDGTGALFKNEKKSKPEHADYTGNIKVEGIDFWLNAWIKTASSGRKYMSLYAMPKEPPGRPVSNKSGALNDEIGL
jgi:hypothetical protein